jgi:hypothetical protein
VILDLPGSTPSKYVLQFGKDFNAYLINRDTMGGMSSPVVMANVSAGNQIITAAAAYTTPMGTYAAIRSTGTGCPTGTSGQTRAVKFTMGSPPTIAIAWCGGPNTNKAPAVSMTDANGTDALVWTIGTDNKLRALDADTGTVVFNGGAAGDTMSAVASFQTPIVANGRIFAASNTQVYAFKP